MICKGDDIWSDQEIRGTERQKAQRVLVFLLQVSFQLLFCQGLVVTEMDFVFMRVFFLVISEAEGGDRGLGYGVRV